MILSSIYYRCLIIAFHTNSLFYLKIKLFRFYTFTQLLLDYRTLFRITDVVEIIINDGRKIGLKKLID
jgi:hypothetical protein